MGIQNVDLRVSNGTPDWDDLLLAPDVSLSLADPERYVNRRLSGAIGILKLCILPSKESLLKLYREHLTSGNNPFQRTATFDFRLIKDRSEHRRHKPGKSNPAADNQLHKVSAILITFRFG